jgi:hypothetical protein
VKVDLELLFNTVDRDGIGRISRRDVKRFVRERERKKRGGGGTIPFTAVSKCGLCRGCSEGACACVQTCGCEQAHVCVCAW